MEHRETIAILDFGSQYSQLIARRVRENHVYSKTPRPHTPASRRWETGARGTILSAEPTRLNECGAPVCHPAIPDLGAPVPGFCYGTQITAASGVPAREAREASPWNTRPWASV